MINQYEKAKLFGITNIRAMIKDSQHELETIIKNLSNSSRRSKNGSIKKYLNKVIHSFSKELEEKTKILDSLKKDTNAITDEHIAKAKTFPIPNLVHLKGKLVKCMFHNEKTPSMYYYLKTNTVFCHSCRKFSDSIGIYMQINNVSFIEAVKALAYAN